MIQEISSLIKRLIGKMYFMYFEKYKNTTIKCIYIKNSICILYLNTFEKKSVFCIWNACIWNAAHPWMHRWQSVILAVHWIWSNSGKSVGVLRTWRSLCKCFFLFVCQSFFLVAWFMQKWMFCHYLVTLVIKLIIFVFCRLLRVLFLHLKADNGHCLYLKSCIVKFVSINSKHT